MASHIHFYLVLKLKLKDSRLETCGVLSLFLISVSYPKYPKICVGMAEVAGHLRTPHLAYSATGGVLWLSFEFVRGVVVYTRKDYFVWAEKRRCNTTYPNTWVSKSLRDFTLKLTCSTLKFYHKIGLIRRELLLRVSNLIVTSNLTFFVKVQVTSRDSVF